MPKVADINTCSLIVSTYNWPEALELCLQSIAILRVLPGEVLVADDGSSCVTEELIERVRDGFPVPLYHIWQEDAGFCKAKIINKAVAAANFDYIIQIDGDVLLERHFVSDHLKMARANYFVRGSRCLLNKRITEIVLSAGKLPGFSYLLLHCLNKLNGLRSLYLMNWLRNYKTKARNRFSLLGCNMAYWRSDFIRINGFNEELTGWGYEDKEFAVRMLNAGCEKQALKMGGIVFHLFHRARSIEHLPNHYRIFQHSIVYKHYACQKGIDQYLSGESA